MSTVQGYENLQRRFAALQGKGSVTLMGELGGRVVQEANAIVPRKTGNLSRSIHIVSKSATAVRVEAAANYAAYVEFGTRPHEITPNVARVLAWGGARRLTGSLRSGAKPEFFAMRVHHPGSRPHPYLIPAAKNAVSKVGADVIVNIWNSAA